MLFWEYPDCGARRSKSGGIKQIPAVREVELNLGRPRKLEVTDREPVRRELHKDHQHSSKELPICSAQH